jgi:hypothetical protein
MSTEGSALTPTSRQPTDAEGAARRLHARRARRMLDAPHGAWRRRQRLFTLRQRRQPRRHHRALVFVEVATVEILSEDEGERRRQSICRFFGICLRTRCPGGATAATPRCRHATTSGSRSHSLPQPGDDCNAPGPATAARPPLRRTRCPSRATAATPPPSRPGDRARVALAAPAGRRLQLSASSAAVIDSGRTRCPSWATTATLRERLRRDPERLRRTRCPSRATTATAQSPGVSRCPQYGHRGFSSRVTCQPPQRRHSSFVGCQSNAGRCSVSRAASASPSPASPASAADGRAIRSRSG